MVKAAVAEALGAQPSIHEGLECPDCHAKFEGVPKYLDHRVNEYVTKSLKGVTTQIEALNIPTADNLVLECKDGICKMVEEHVEATFNVTKKGEEAPEESSGSFLDYKDEPEETEK